MGLLSIFSTRKRQRKNALKTVPDKSASSKFKKAGSLNSARIPVGELRIGMYISSLDRPWEETPFLMQGFYVRSEADIEEISKHCNHVYVDVVTQRSATTEGPKGMVSEQESFVHRLPDPEEWEQTEHHYDRARSLTRSIVDEVRMGNAVNQESVRDVVMECVDSILNNFHTLVWVSQMSQKGIGMESHAMGVCVLAVAFGRYLGYSREELEKLAECALLHDLGMLKLPDDLMQRVMAGENEFNSQDLKRIRMHTTYGRDLLMSSACYMGAVDVAYSHHERYDGSGYPRGLKGGSIPTFAQIIALADAYDAMTGSHSYQDAISSLDALKLLYEQRGKQFDPELTLNFIRFISIYPPGAIVQIRDGRIGIVVDRNQSHKHLPKVLLLRDEEGSEITPKLINLQELYYQPGGKKYVICKMYPPGSFSIVASDYLDSEQLHAQ